MAAISTLTYPSTGTLLVSMNLYINPAQESYRHRLSYKVGSNSFGELLSQTNESLSAIWTPQAFLARQNPDGRELECVFTLYTYENETAEEPLGTETYTMTLTIPDTETFQPAVTVEWLTDSVIVEGIENPIKKGSSVTANITRLSSRYGSSITECTLSVGDDSQNISSTGTYSLGTFDTEGEYTISLSATDSRGYVTNISYPITVVSYYKPYIAPIESQEQIICGTCLEDGTLNSFTGTYLRIAAKKIWCAETSTGEVNSCTLQYRYRVEGGEWNDLTTLLAANSETDEIDTILNLGLDIATNYEVELIATDLDNNTKTLSYLLERKFCILEYPEHAYIGDYLTINIAPQTATEYCYELYYYDSGKKEIISKDDGNKLTASFYAPSQMVLAQSNSKTYDYILYFKVYENTEADTPLQSEEYTMTIEIPNNSSYAPDLSAEFLLSPSIQNNTLIYPTCSVNIGKLIINDYECVGKYGAYAFVESIKVGEDFSASPEVLETPFETDVFTSSGRKIAVLTAKDTRGLTTSVEYTFNVVDYQVPTLTPAEGEDEIICKLCKADGTFADNGTYLRIIANKGCYSTDLNGNENTCNLQYRYKIENNEWTEWTTVENNNKSGDIDTGALNVNFTNNVIYSIEIRAVDASNTYSEIYNTSFKRSAIYMHRAKDALSIGEKAIPDSKSVTIAEDWSVYVKGTLGVDSITFKDAKTGWEYIGYVYDGNWITCRKFESVEVTQMPDRTEYREGDVFNPTGMIITGTYSDGTTTEIIHYHHPEIVEEVLKIFCIDGGVYVTIGLTISGAAMSKILIDFEYTDNGDETYTLTGWKETHNGEESTELVIPDEPGIIL